MKTLQFEPETIFQSDQDREYIAMGHRRLIAQRGLSQFCNSRRRMTDNGYMELWFKSMKLEMQDRRSLVEDRSMYISIRSRVDIGNRDRLHSSLGYRSRIEFECEYVHPAGVRTFRRKSPALRTAADAER